MRKLIFHFKLAFLLLFILSGGCTKEDYTLPVSFELQFDIEEKPVMNGLLTVESIAINLRSIDISGYREIGDDIFFTRNFSERKRIEIKKNTIGQTLEFDIPQGLYRPLFFSLNFLPDENEEEILEDIEEWYEYLAEGEDDLEELQEELGEIIEDYLEDVLPCLILRGKYIRNNVTYHLIFALNDPITYKISAKNINEGTEVALNKDRVNKGRMVLNPSYWFSVISPAMLDGVFIGEIDNEKYIFIHKLINPQIYTAIFNRIEQSTYLVINE